MTLRRHIGALPVALAFACALACVVVLAAPVVARATDIVSWADAYHGPDPINVDGADPIPVAGAANAVAFSDASHGWMVGARFDGVGPLGGGVKTAWYAFSSDAGSTWTSASIPASPALGVEMFAVAAPASGIAVAAGENGTIARFGGVSWTTTQVAGWSGRAIRALAFADASHGWAVGDGGGILSTTDGGLTWSTDSAPGTAPAWNAVAVADSTHVWVVGNGGAMALWNGAGWSARASGTSSSLRTIAFADATHGRAGGDGVTFVQTSGGTTWGPVPVPLPPGGPTVGVRAISYSPTGTCFAVGTGLSVWRTTDGGVTWLAGTSDGSTNNFGNGTITGVTLTGLAFPPGSGALPVAVGRPSDVPNSAPTSKAWAFRATQWDRRLPDSPQWQTASQVGTSTAAVVHWYLAHTDDLGFLIARSASGGPFLAVASVPSTSGSWVSYAWTDTSVSAEVTYTYRITTFSTVGTSPPALATAHVHDYVTPVTTATIGGLPVRTGWYTAPLLVTLTVADAVPSTPTVTRFDLDGAGMQDYAAPLVLASDGVHTLKYLSVDAGGNVEATRAATVRLDATPPTTTASVPVTMTAGSIVLLQPVDGASGVASTRWSLDGSSATSGTAASVGAPGAHTLTWSSADVAGNRETTRSADYSVVGPPSPVTTLKALGATLTASPSAWFTTRTVVTLAPDVEATTYAGLDGASTVATAAIVLAKEGTSTLRYFAVGPAGNREETRTMALRLDSAPPVTSSDAIGFYLKGATLTLSASDGVSGVASTRWLLQSTTPGALPISGATRVVRVVALGLYRLQFSSADAAGNREVTRTVSFTVADAVAAPVATSVTIRASSARVRTGARVVLSGTARPDSLAGGVVDVYVRKPGRSTYSYSSRRGVYLSGGHPAWSYGYYFRAGMTRGLYYIKAVVPARAGFLRSTSPVPAAVRLY